MKGHGEICLISMKQFTKDFNLRPPTPDIQTVVHALILIITHIYQWIFVIEI